MVSLSLLYMKIFEPYSIFLLYHLGFYAPNPSALRLYDTVRSATYTMSSAPQQVTSSNIEISGLSVTGEEKVSPQDDHTATFESKNVHDRRETFAVACSTSEAKAEHILAVPAGCADRSKMHNPADLHAAAILTETARSCEEAPSSLSALITEPTSDKSKKSAWVRLRETLAHDPLNDPEFVDAYNDWRRRNRKERCDRRKACIKAHGFRVGCLIKLVDHERSKEAWAAYQKKLSYMED